MSDLITELRSPRFHVMDKSVAVFDVTGTALVGYLVADYMKWNKPLTIASLFALGHLVHMELGIKTAFNDVEKEENHEPKEKC